MRFTAAALLWLVTTVALAAAVPLVWLQRNVIDADGDAALAYRAAVDPAVQAGAAEELTAQVMRLLREHRYDAQYDIAPAAVRSAAASYTAGPAFPAQFTALNRTVHDQLLAGGGGGGGGGAGAGAGGAVLVDVAPMLESTEFTQLLADYQLQVPSTLAVPLTLPRPDALRPLSSWTLLLAAVSVLLTAAAGVMTVLVARRRGRALAGVGVSALLVGAGGWAGIEVGRRHLADALSTTTSGVRRIATGIADSAEVSLHHWFDATLIGGTVLVASGVLVAMTGLLVQRQLRT